MFITSLALLFVLYAKTVLKVPLIPKISNQNIDDNRTI